MWCAQAKKESLDGLQDEQARLKAEYDRMEVSFPCPLILISRPMRSHYDGIAL